MESMLKVGTTYLIGLPPGWIIAGTVMAVKDGVAVFKNAVHLELVNSDAVFITDIPYAKTAKELAKIPSAARPIRDGFSVNLTHLTYFVPCVMSMESLHGKREADAISALK